MTFFKRIGKSGGIRKPMRFGVNIVFATQKYSFVFSTFEMNEEYPPFLKYQNQLEENTNPKDRQNPLIEKLEMLIETNLDNEQFGVEQLAKLMNMSRSHLHRKLHKAKGQSISRFIREYRLEKARQLLIDKDITASEAAHAVGFGSASYFNKCFTEHFGYSPGKARERMIAIGQIKPEKTTYSDAKNTKKWWWAAAALAVIASFGLWWSTNEKKVVETTVVVAPEKKSIIVLPFKNLSSNKENQYLADGMVDAISRHLSEIESLEVINSGASGPLKSVKEIGETLNISTVLIGSIQKQDSIIRVEVKLLNSSDESQIWADYYDRKLNDVLTINSEIAQNVAMAMETTFTPKERQVIEKRSSYNPAAYDYYMQGEYYLSQLTPVAVAKAIKLYEKAIQVDSTLAQAYLGIAGTFLWKSSTFGSELEPKEAIKSAKPYIETAIKYDSNLWESDTQQAYISLYYDLDFEKSERLFLASYEQATPIYQAIYLNLLLHEHRYAEAIEYNTEFTTKFPFYPNSAIPAIAVFTDNYEWGKEFIDNRVSTNSVSLFNLGAFGFFHLNFGEYDEAISYFNKETELFGVRLPRTISLIGASYAKKGDTQKAYELINELKTLKLKSDAGSPAWGIAIIYTALGNKKEALRWLTVSIDDGEQERAWLVSEPQFFPLHGMPEFDAFVKQLGFREHAYPVELPERVD
ncbi:helix-turn-helix domain-containing protein [Zobellia sp.]|nr:helix-turn-helix domain-containing protein [Zobellia sp.]